MTDQELVQRVQSAEDIYMDAVREARTAGLRTTIELRNPAGYWNKIGHDADGYVRTVVEYRRAT